jgi:hypothetical protein
MDEFERQLNNRLAIPFRLLGDYDDVIIGMLIDALFLSFRSVPSTPPPWS